ncbi:MAG: hypothetical protein MRERV_64c008 [Mycoplasmataceae bacterium RV_VA103A]|nr:MAG: hypothetical protein MRERV_64c008 [Mycoplasmataceae bacterium RV_VA103A]
MIKIFYQLEKSKNYFKYIKIQGHAEYASYGKDLVCAGFSAIVNGTINFLQENYAQNCKILVSSNEVLINCLFPDKQDFQLCLKMFFYQVKNIAFAYPQCFQFLEND